MNLPDPFAYPAEPYVRRHGPQGYTDYRDFKPWLRDEFTFRCVYCLERETWYPSRAAGFSADHFEPRVVNPARAADYTNLVYACSRCNAFKSARIVLLDPTATALAAHLRVRETGDIQGLTPEGQDLIDLLCLNESPAVEVRQETLLLLRAKQEFPDNPTIHALFLKRFGYPKDLPDLKSLRPPGGNRRPEGVADCHHEKRQRGELAEVY